MFKSKAETLSFLKNKVKLSKIPQTFFFSTTSWKKNKKKILKKIRNDFNSQIVIRSSAADEDNKNFSNAGKYFSFLKVNPNNSKDVEKKINNIIKSYKKTLKGSKILIQKMINPINCSGVIFNRDLSSGSKYYVINYDDVSGRSDTVTSGITKSSNRVLFAYHNKISNVKSKRFFKLLTAIKEVEKIYNFIPLDIEFIIMKNFKIYILQVRPLIIRKKITKDEEELTEKILNKLRKKIKHKIKNWNTVYGQMPDWNPAEIIGKNPHPLSYSLYKLLVLDSSWIKARKLMGYSAYFENKNLMDSFAGQPYIDVRKSFISFTPAFLEKKLRHKLVDYYVTKLKNNPSLHDKIEFDVSINCFIFDFSTRFKKLCPNLLSKKEISSLEQNYKAIFIKNLFKNNIGSIDQNLKKINQLNKNFEKIKENNSLKEIINLTIRDGVIPFSILARHAFISENMIRSLIRLKYLSLNDSNNFKSSLETVTSQFITDCKKLSKNSISFSKFKSKYGHLRPGTYDLNSDNYSKFDRSFFTKKNSSTFKKMNKFILNSKKILKIDKILKKNDLPFNSKFLFDYFKRSIESREYGKFIFTKNINLLLNKINKIAKKNNISSNKITFLKISDIINLSNKKNITLFKKKIIANERLFKIYQKVRLPLLLTDPESVHVSPFQVSLPNFIGDKKISSKVIHINNNFNIKKMSLKDKLVLIENADPGYDWLFNFKIKGLITKFGGSNSHMAIRCNELQIPAAIGVGEKIYQELKEKTQIILNCNQKKIETN